MKMKHLKWEKGCIGVYLYWNLTPRRKSVSKTFILNSDPQWKVRLEEELLVCKPWPPVNSPTHLLTPCSPIRSFCTVVLRLSVPCKDFRLTFSSRRKKGHSSPVGLPVSRMWSALQHSLLLPPTSYSILFVVEFDPLPTEVRTGMWDGRGRRTGEWQEKERGIWTGNDQRSVLDVTRTYRGFVDKLVICAYWHHQDSRERETFYWRLDVGTDLN